MLSSKKKLCKQITGEKRELPRSNAAVRYVGNVELNAQVVLMISILCLQRRGGVVFVFQVFLRYMLYLLLFCLGTSSRVS